MSESGVDRVFKFLVVCGVLVSGFLVFRLSRLDPISLMPGRDPKGAVENYKLRIRATERLIQREQL